MESSGRGCHGAEQVLDWEGSVSVCAREACRAWHILSSRVRTPGVPFGKGFCLYKKNGMGSKLETARTGCGSPQEGRQCWAILFSIRTLVGPGTV